MVLRAHELPVIGTWYWDLEHASRFAIVATDNGGDEGIEIQYFEGEVEEIDMETWYMMRVVSIAAPSDWTGPFELEGEDSNNSKDETQHPSNWTGLINLIE